MGQGRRATLSHQLAEIGPLHGDAADGPIRQYIHDTPASEAPLHDVIQLVLFPQIRNDSNTHYLFIPIDSRLGIYGKMLVIFVKSIDVRCNGVTTKSLQESRLLIMRQCIPGRAD